MRSSSLNSLARRNTVVQPVAGDELVEGLLAVGDGGERASHSIGPEMTAVETSQGAP